LDDQILTNIISIAAGRGFSMALKKGGTVVAWGRVARRYPVHVPEGLSNVVAIAAGAEDFCLAITTNKAVADRFAEPPPVANPDDQ
jgi:alpha-tubulin suppressor-like RCC1 family protein